MAINYFDQLGFGQAMNRPFEVANSLASLEGQKLQNESARLQNQAMQTAMNTPKAPDMNAVRQRISQGSALINQFLKSGQVDRAAQAAMQYEQDFKMIDPTFSAAQLPQVASTPQGLQMLIDETSQLIQSAAGPEQMARFTAGQMQPQRQQADPAKVLEFKKWLELNPDATQDEKRAIFNQMVVPQERALATGQGAGQARVMTEQQLTPVLAEREKAVSAVKAEAPKAVADLQKAQAEAQAAQEKLAEVETRKVKQIDLSRQTMQLAREIANSPNLDQVTGVGAQFPTFLPESQDIILKAEQLIALLTADNLKLMSGVLTDKDIQMLSTLSSGMKVSDKGIKGSASAIRKRLNDIAANIEKELLKVEQTQQPQQAQPTLPQVGQFKIVEIR